MTRRILLIDDRTERRELLGVVLRASTQAEIDAPADPVSVGEALRDPAPAVIVLAHPCPWLPDFDLTRRVVAAFEGVPVVLLTEPHRADAHEVAREIPGCRVVPADPGAALQVRDAVQAVWPPEPALQEDAPAEDPAEEDPTEDATTPGDGPARPGMASLGPSMEPVPPTNRRQRPRLPPKEDAPTMLMPALKRPLVTEAPRDPNVVELDGARRLRGARLDELAVPEPAEPTPESPGTATVRESRGAPARLEDILADLEGAGTVHLAPDDGDADCEKLLADVRRTLAGALEETEGQITRGPLPTLPIPPNQLAQVLQILISNALKYRGEAPPRVHVRAERDGRVWQIHVEDNGRGVAPDQRDRIFERFQRGADPDKVPGTGIGLSVCKRIVEAHGGRIWVKPSASGGAVFVFTVPAAEAQMQA